MPTLRAADTPTLSPDAPPGDVPTIASPPTVRPEATLSSAPTTAQPAPTPSAKPGPGSPAPLLPTILTPPTARVEPLPVAAKPTPPARPAPPLVPRPAARKGGGPGLIVGLGLAGVLAIAVIAGGGWYLFGRKGPAPEPSPAAFSTPPTQTPALAEAGTSSPPEATAPAETREAASAAPEPTAQPAPRGTGGGAATRPTTPVAPAALPPRADTPPSGGEAGGGDYAYLDDLPSEAPDGRAAGEALAQKYRSGGSTGSTATSFRPRPRVPPGVTMPERRAVATLLYLHSAQEAYQRKSGRYGNLRELADASLLALDVPFDAEGFRRARYVFRATAEGDGYRVEAAPQGAVGRAFVVDDSGFVRLRDD